MELRTLRYFAQIAELGSITAASQRLGVAQPSLTRHIHQLEANLGVTLFVRANRGVTLTAAGASLLESATRILRDVDHTARALRREGGVAGGKVVLGITPTLCPVLLPRLIARLRRDYPLIELQVQQSGSMILPGWLLDGKADTVVMAQIGSAQYLVTTPLAHEEMVLVTSPNSRSEGPVSADELGSTTLILTEALYTIMRGLLFDTEITLQVELVLNSIEAIKLMVEEDLCRTVMPYSIIRRDQQRGLVVAHRLLDGRLQRSLVVATASGRRITPATEAVVACIRAITADLVARGEFVL